MKEYKINIPIYDKTIYLWKGDKKKFERYILKKYSYDINEKISGYTAMALYGMGEKLDDGVYLPKDVTLSTIVHESIHLAWSVLNLYRININIDNQEPLTYLTEFIVNELCKKTKVKKWSY